MADPAREIWTLLASVAIAALAVVLIASAILHKRNEAAAIAWVGLILLSPLFGSIAYLLFGINRIKRRAMRVRPDAVSASGRHEWPAGGVDAPVALADGHETPGAAPRPETGLRRLTDALTGFAMTRGNAVRILVNGDEAYPRMLAAIEGAETSVAFQTYLFSGDAAGAQFCEALARAQARGAAVRVLVDGVGDFLSRPSVIPTLRHHGLTYARFLHSFWPWRMPYLNLRNHRKLLIVDGTVAFTGGMNIGEGNRVAANPRHPVRDLHFELEGPIVGQLTDVFADDWHFTTGETLDDAVWFPPPALRGATAARAIASGPHEPIDRMRWLLHAAITEARERLRIQTPYFLPDETLVTALRLAALRGVEIDIVVPSRSNLFFVDWAGRARWADLLVDGCRIWLGPPPFNHSKIFLVDDTWALIGSTNWDPRSLRLNFEINVECHDADIAARLSEVFEAERRASRPLTLEALKQRPLAARLRDGVARLFAPYL